MSDAADRRAELIGAALAGELTAQEQEELEDACRRDPSVREELAQLREVAGRVAAAGPDWAEADPRADLGERVASLGEPPPSPPQDAPVGTRHWRARAVQGVAAACLVGIGVLGTLGYQRTVDAPAEGPPGTLGAVEEISFTGEPTGSEVEAALVAHTWGTETVLEIDGLEVGETFEVVLVSATGEELSSGTFLGAQASVECRMNAAIMREEVAQVRIDSTDDPNVRLVADLPVVAT